MKDRSCQVKKALHKLFLKQLQCKVYNNFIFKLAKFCKLYLFYTLHSHISTSINVVNLKNSLLSTLEKRTKQVNTSHETILNIFNVQCSGLCNCTRKSPVRKDEFYVKSSTESPNLANEQTVKCLSKQVTASIFFIMTTCLEMLILWVRVSWATG